MIANRLALRRFGPDAQNLIIACGVFAVSYFGLQALLKPLYLLRLGYDLPYIGIFNGTGAFTYMVMSVLTGMAGRYVSNRSIMLGGGIITILGMAALPLSEFMPASWRYGYPLFTHFVSSGGWAFFNVSLIPALMARATPENRNDAFALNNTSRRLGTFVGTLMGGVLPSIFAFWLAQSVDQPAPYRYALLVGAALGLAGLVPLLRLARVDTTVQESSATEEESAAFPVLATILLLLHVYLSSSGTVLCQTFCSAYMDTELHLSTVLIGLLTGIGQFAAIFTPLAAPRLAAKWGNGWILMSTTLGMAVSLLPLIYLHNWFGAGVGRFGTIALSALWLPALQVYQMEMVSKRWRTLAYGVLQMVVSLNITSMSLAGGYIAAGWGYANLFLLAVGLTLLGALLMAGMRRLAR